MSKAQQKAEGSVSSGLVVWMTGRPSSGKSTFAERVIERLRGRGVACCVLDGDAVRSALVPAPGYTPEARDAFYETLARLAALIAKEGLVVLVPATAYKAAYRQRARELAPRFVEVYVRTSAAECAARDAKGLYEAARSGRVTGVPGADLPYEEPASPDIVADGGLDDEAASRVSAEVERLIHGAREEAEGE